MPKHSDFHRERERSTTTLKMSHFVSMTKHFNLGSGRVLFAEKKGPVYKIKIFEIGSDNRYVDFSIVRWASFVRAIDEVKNAIYELHTNSQLKFCHHLRAATTSPCLKTSNVLTSGLKLTILFYKKILINAS